MSVVGPKAARLGELIGAGLPVPDGVVLSVDVHRTALAVAGVAEQVAAGVAELIERVGGAGDLDQRVAALREVAGRAEMSVGHRSALLAAYSSLVSGDADAGGIGPAVAVRSSAIGEDTEDASFAGTYDSVTDVVGADAVLAAVGVCWSSSVSTRSIAYRAGMARQPSGASDPAMAVIVQRMAPSQRSGVMFTVDPRAAVDRLVIEAVGAGGSVVSGGSDPERFEVDRTSGIIVDATRPSGDGDPSATSAPVLSHAEVAALNELGRSIEDHFGTPQDVEWTIGSDGSIWIVQSRPITGRPATAPGSATPGSGGSIPMSGGAPTRDDPDAVLTGTGASAGPARRRGAGRAGHVAGVAAGAHAGRGRGHRHRRHGLSRRHRRPRASDPVRGRGRGSDRAPGRRRGRHRRRERGNRQSVDPVLIWDRRSAIQRCAACWAASAWSRTSPPRSPAAG